MAEFKPQTFAYAHDAAVLKALRICANSNNRTITDGYAFLEEEGETAAFYNMIDIATKGGNDILYVNSVKEFAGDSLEDFKTALTRIESAGLRVISLSENDYAYAAFMTAIKVLEDTTPKYLKSKYAISAAAMHKVGASIETICEELGLRPSEVHEIIASYKREEEKEQAEE